MKKINLAITGCLGRMGQQLIKSSKSAKNLFNLINKYSLLNVVTQSNLMCISEKVLLVLKQIKWKKEFIFSPGEEEFSLDKIR